MPNTPEMNEDTTMVPPMMARAAGVMIAFYADRASAPSIMSTVFFSP